MRTQWSVFEELVHQLDPVLRAMTAHGVRIDRVRRDQLLERVRAEKEELIHACQTLVPPEIRPTRLWKKRPEDHEVEEARAPGQIKVCSVCGAEVESKAVHLKGGKKNPCAGAEVRKQPGQQRVWLERLPFNPLSRDQLLEYLARFKHLPGKHIKTGRETVDDRTLQQLVKKHGERHPLYARVLKIRALQKVEGTFLAALEGDWATGHFSHAPETGRLSMASANWQQFSHRDSALHADEIRRCVLPRPGHVFVEADSSAIEAVLTGYFARDPLYMDLATKGVHAFLTCKDLGLEFTPANVKIAKAHHRYALWKRTVHLTNFGGGPRMLQAAAPEVFTTLRKAEEAQAAYLAEFPRIPEWWAEVRAFAHKHGYLQNPFGWRCYFWNVYRRRPDGLHELGEDGRACIAFLPQSSAAMFMRQNLKQMARDGWGDYMPCIGSVHDSVCLDVPEERQEEAVAYLAQLLTRPIPELGGLQIGCEIKAGPSWGDLETVRVCKMDPPRDLAA